MKTIKGTFQVKLTPAEISHNGDGINQFRRLTLDKTFEGELAASSKGEMLSVLTAKKGSAGYVVIECVQGTLEGKKGSFALQHYGLMCCDSQHLTLEVVPDSGTNELLGLSGSMKIIIQERQHYYEFNYELENWYCLSLVI